MIEAHPLKKSFPNPNEHRGKLSEASYLQLRCKFMRTDPYAKICFPDIINNLNVKVFNLMSRTNETRFIEWHEKCKC